jgi:hypothetical protein
MSSTPIQKTLSDFKQRLLSLSIEKGNKQSLFLDYRLCFRYEISIFLTLSLLCTQLLQHLQNEIPLDSSTTLDKIRNNNFKNFHVSTNKIPNPFSVYQLDSDIKHFWFLNGPVRSKTLIN